MISHEIRSLLMGKSYMSANEPVMRLTGDILKAVERIARIDSYYRDSCGQRKALREQSYDLVILTEYS